MATAPVLSGTRAIITGAGRGLGEAIARKFVEAGASVLLCARDGASVAHVADALRSGLRDGQQILVRAVDVSRTTELDALVRFALDAWPGVDALVNNAGMQGPIGPLGDNDWAQWVATVETNLLGPVYLSRALLPTFAQAGRGKIVNVSGGGATKAMPAFSAYAASKAGLVRFTETLAEELRAAHVDVNAIAPGVLKTRLLDEVLAAGPGKAGADYHAQILKVLEKGGASPDLAADLCVYLASRASDGITGKLISAVWDPWRDFDQHRADLEKSDIYTLRRIVPAERGKTWGG